MNSPRRWLPGIWLLICLLLPGSLRPLHAASPQATLALGTIWDESENGWTGVWTRRSSTNVFDAVWTKDGGQVTAVLTMTQTGAGTVAIHRKDTSDSMEVDYVATLGPDGSVTGTGKVSSTGFDFHWTAHVRNHLGTPLHVDIDLDAAYGDIWEESENGWTGVWTRRQGLAGVFDAATGTWNHHSDPIVFDAVWTNNGSRVTAVLTMTQTGPGTVAIHRKDTSDSLEVDYVGTITEGFVAGTGTVKDTGFAFRWNARIRFAQAPTNPPALADGTVWDESENGWTGVWTRRSGTNVFDAVWTKDGNRVTAELTMTQTAPDTVAIHRKDTSDSLEVDYVATLGPNGAVTGTGTIKDNGFVFPWNARIR